MSMVEGEEMGLAFWQQRCEQHNKRHNTVVIVNTVIMFCNTNLESPQSSQYGAPSFQIAGLLQSFCKCRLKRLLKLSVKTLPASLACLQPSRLYLLH